MGVVTEPNSNPAAGPYSANQMCPLEGSYSSFTAEFSNAVLSYQFSFGYASAGMEQVRACFIS